MKLEFRPVQRKPVTIPMAPVTKKEALRLLREGYDGKRVSFSDEDIEAIKKSEEDRIVGFIATDGDSYWFVNYDYAKQHYDIDKETD